MFEMTRTIIEFAATATSNLRQIQMPRPPLTLRADEPKARNVGERRVPRQLDGAPFDDKAIAAGGAWAALSQLERVEAMVGLDEAEEWEVRKRRSHVS